MLEPTVKKTDIGVVVARFQVDELTEGQHDLIKTVISHHDKVLIFLGISPAKNTQVNPMDYKTRELMIRESYPDVTVLPIYDVNNDEQWSRTLDKRIREVFSIGSVTLYGSRDGFIPKYKGGFQTVELEPRVKVSGSEIRKKLSQKIVSSKDFRHGVIYASHDRYPTTFPTVDAAILDEKGRVLLARKKTDDPNKWRFIGGFVDINQDDSFQEAVKREVMEETNSLGVGEPEYIGSAKIDDWRYRDERDGIITTFFAIPYLFGDPKASDDIDDLRWFDCEQVIRNEGFIFVEEHKPLYNLFKAYLNRTQKKQQEASHEN